MNVAKTYQTSLFEDKPRHVSVREAIQNITWSHSRRSTLEQCTRRYYYEYFGANKRTARREPAKETLHFLKNRVQNRYMLAGSALHTVVKTFFDKAQLGDLWDVARLIRFARKIFRESWSYSQAHPDGKVTPNRKYPPILLQEYYYEHPEAEDLCAAEENRLVNALHSFATNDLYDQFRAAGSAPAALVERKIKLGDFPCKVAGKIDLAYQANAGVSVVDWKLGPGDGTGDDSLQLGVYAVWATDHFKCSPDAIRVCKVHLSSNETADFRANAQVLASVRARIIQDAERMAAIEEYGKEAMVEAFTRCEKPSICNLCVFRRVCYD